MLEFNYCFARGKRFRVELYIDAKSQATGKQIFDMIHSQKTALESILGDVSCERINDKVASRIALYHPGSITDPEEELKALRMWAVEKMIVFYNTLDPVTSKVVREVIKP